MIVHRIEWLIKNGMFDTACELLREEDNAAMAAAVVDRPPARIDISLFGPVSRVAMAWIYPSIAERDANAQAWVDTGRVPAFNEKWKTVSDRSLSNEIFDLHSSSTNDTANTISVRWIKDTVSHYDSSYIDALDEWVIKDRPYSARLMTAKYGRMEGVILEVDYADLSDYQAQFNAWATQPGIEQFWEVMGKATLPGGSTQVWRMWP